MIRDLEIQRLINYSKGLGLKVTFKPGKSGSSAEWTLDNTEITVYKKVSDPKIKIVLNLIHELGHALHNIHEKDRKLDKKFEDAIGHVSEAEDQSLDTEKRQRKVILDNEIAGTKYWDIIYKDTNMKFPYWKLEAAKEYDMWQYEYWYENGKDVTMKMANEKLKEIKKKYKND